MKTDEEIQEFLRHLPLGYDCTVTQLLEMIKDVGLGPEDYSRIELIVCVPDEQIYLNLNEKMGKLT